MYLPTTDTESITESGISLDSQVDGIFSYAIENSQTKVEVGSGEYTFVCAAPTRFSELSEAIKRAERNLEESVLAGWDQLQQQIVAAKQVFADKSSTQTTVDQAIVSLQQAMDALILRILRAIRRLFTQAPLRTSPDLTGVRPIL